MDMNHSSSDCGDGFSHVGTCRGVVMGLPLIVMCWIPVIVWAFHQFH